jgi:hypothetical protein
LIGLHGAGNDDELRAFDNNGYCRFRANQDVKRQIDRN